MWILIGWLIKHLNMSPPLSPPPPLLHGWHPLTLTPKPLIPATTTLTLLPVYLPLPGQINLYRRVNELYEVRGAALGLGLGAADPLENGAGAGGTDGMQGGGGAGAATVEGPTGATEATEASGGSRGSALASVSRGSAPPLHAWWALLPPPLDVVVGLRQVQCVLWGDIYIYMCVLCVLSLLSWLLLHNYTCNVCINVSTSLISISHYLSTHTRTHCP